MSTVYFCWYINHSTSLHKFTSLHPQLEEMCCFPLSVHHCVLRHCAIKATVPGNGAHTDVGLRVQGCSSRLFTAQIVFVGVYLLTPSKKAYLRQFGDLESGLAGGKPPGGDALTSPLVDLSSTLSNHSRKPSEAFDPSDPDASQVRKTLKA